MNVSYECNLFQSQFWPHPHSLGTVLYVKKTKSQLAQFLKEGLGFSVLKILFLTYQTVFSYCGQINLCGGLKRMQKYSNGTHSDLLLICIYSKCFDVLQISEIVFVFNLQKHCIKSGIIVNFKLLLELFQNNLKVSGECKERFTNILILWFECSVVHHETSEEKQL